MIGLWFRRMVSSVGENKNLTIFLLSTQYVFWGFFPRQTHLHIHEWLTQALLMFTLLWEREDIGLGAVGERGTPILWVIIKQNKLVSRLIGRSGKDDEDGKRDFFFKVNNLYLTPHRTSLHKTWIYTYMHIVNLFVYKQIYVCLCVCV